MFCHNVKKVKFVLLYIIHITIQTKYFFIVNKYINAGFMPEIG